MARLTRALDPNNLRSIFDLTALVTDFARGVKEDRGFLRLARRTLLPLPTDRQAPPPDFSFPEAEPLAVPALERRQVAVVLSGGSGATAAAIGVQRAFEEASLTPQAISASSGGVLFGAPWACGLPASRIADFWLRLPARRYLDPDWRSLLRASVHRFGGWAGLLRGDALEASLRDLVGELRLGDTRVPFSMVAWNVDLNRVEQLGTVETPELAVAKVMRVAISIPIFVEPVSLRGHVYGDGGVVNIFPVRPLLARNPDHILGLNCYLPENFSGEDVTGWRARPFSILKASGQLRWSGMVALAREQALLAGDKLELLHPVPYSAVRGARFYETFVDRSRWPEFIRAGRTATREALGRLEARAKAAARPS